MDCNVYEVHKNIESQTHFGCFFNDILTNPATFYDTIY